MQLFQYYLKKKDKNITIIGATSGDTGSAAIDACKDKDNINIFILHPKNKTSDIQRKQMTTVTSKNVFNIAIDGTFDDCQRLVKSTFLQREMAEDLNLTSANSINISRLVPQSFYYFEAAKHLPVSVKPTFAIPSGNFGNICAGILAKSMGLPIDHFIASPDNIIQRN